MSFNKSFGTIQSAYVSLSNGTPSATWFTATANHRAYIFEIVLTTNDTANPLITISGATTGTIVKYYTYSGAPVLDATNIPFIVRPGDAVTIAAGAVTAAKTVECKCNYLLSLT